MVLVLLACLLGDCSLVAAEGLWEVFQLAKDNDPQLRAAEATLLAAQQAKPKVMATLLPSLAASGSNGLNHFEDKNPPVDLKTGASRPNQDYDSKKYGLFLTQPVLNVQSWVGWPMADQRQEEAESSYRATVAEFCLRVLERYLKALSAEDKLHWVRVEKMAIEQGLLRARRASQLGLISPTAEYKAQAGYDMAVADEIAAENALENSRGDLRELTGGEHHSLAHLKPGLVLSPPEPNDLEKWKRLALTQNHTLLAKEHALDGARLEVLRQMAGHLPTLNLTASHYYEDTGGRTPGEDTVSSVALELKVPIFDGGAVTAQTREARHLQDKARQEYEGLRRQIIKKASESFRGVNESLRRVKALQQALKSNLAAVQATQHEVEVGASTMVDFLESLRDLYRARRDLTDAMHEYLLNRVRLMQLSGVLTEKDIRVLSQHFQEGPPADPGAILPVVMQMSQEP
ncbi:MAG: TolC family outer membrane protein [Pseudomonadota bacterium]